MAEPFRSLAAYPPRQVASAMINGMACGLYHLPSPDWLQNRLVDTMAGVSPRNNALIEWASMPLLCVIEWAFRRESPLASMIVV